MKKIMVLSGLVSFFNYASERPATQTELAHQYLKEAQDFHNSCRHLILDFQDHEIKESPSSEVSGTTAKGIAWLSAAMLAWGVDWLAQSVGASGLQGAALTTTSALIVQKFLYNQLYIKRSPQGALIKINKLLEANKRAIQEAQSELSIHSDAHPYIKKSIKAYCVVANTIKSNAEKYPHNPHIKKIETKCEKMIKTAERFIQES